MELTNDGIPLVGLIFDVICQSSCDWHSDVVKSSEIKNSLAHMGRDVSIYKIRKCLKQLEADGMIKRKSEGCPAFYSYEGECIDEGHPPRNGWCLTSAGRDTDEYKYYFAEYMESLRKWAEGE